MMWHLRPLQILAFKNEKNSKVCFTKSQIEAMAWDLQKFILDFLFNVSLPFYNLIENPRGLVVFGHNYN